MPSHVVDKASVRAKALVCRDSISLPDRIRRSTAACDRLFEEMKTGLTMYDKKRKRTGRTNEQNPIVAVYQHMGSEVDVDSFAVAAYRHGWQVAFPCMMQQEDAPAETVSHASEKTKSPKQRAQMTFRIVPEKLYAQGGADFMLHPLKSYRANDPVLASTTPCPISVIDGIVVPMTAFDTKNNRLGYGGGNYDRLLAEKMPTTIVIGIAFHEQHVPIVPTEPHDQPLPRIIEA